MPSNTALILGQAIILLHHHVTDVMIQQFGFEDGSGHSFYANGYSMDYTHEVKVYFTMYNDQIEVKTKIFTPRASSIIAKF